MTPDRDLERTVDALLQGIAPPREPAGLLDSIDTLVGRTRQRPRWLAYLKEPPMRLGANVAFGSPIARVACLSLALLLVSGLTAGAVTVGANLLASPSPSIVLPYPEGPGTFTPGPDMAGPYGSQAVWLLDGSILFLGGTTTERWDPATRTFHPSGAMIEPKSGPAVLLHDGRVLVAGGQLFSTEPGGGPRTASAEIWDPATETWSATGSLAQPTAPSAAVVLADGRVLVLSGDDDNGIYTAPFTQIWDPATGTFSAGPSPLRHGGASAILLGDGRVVAIDGSHAEVWDPETEAFAEAGSMNHYRLWTFTVPLADGRILAIGGPPCLGCSPVRTAEVWDPATSTFTDAGDMAVGRTQQGTLTLLPDGRVLVIGGPNKWDAAPEASSEIWDPATDTFSAGAELSVGRGQHAAVLLDDGTVLIAGGYTGPLDEAVYPTTTEIWVPGSGS